MYYTEILVGGLLGSSSSSFFFLFSGAMQSDRQVALQRKILCPLKGCYWSKQRFIEFHHTAPGLATQDVRSKTAVDAQ